MTRNARLRVVIELSTAGLMLLTLATAVALRPGAAPPPAPAAVVDMTVVLDVKTRKYHCPACELVRKCAGPDCETMDIAEAIRRGAKPCELCGGTCIAGGVRR